MGGSYKCKKSMYEIRTSKQHNQQHNQPFLASRRAKWTWVCCLCEVHYHHREYPAKEKKSHDFDDRNGVRNKWQTHIIESWNTELLQEKPLEVIDCYPRWASHKLPRNFLPKKNKLSKYLELLHPVTLYHVTLTCTLSFSVMELEK